MTTQKSVGAASPTYDVIIAGAGPVGLFLACELRLADVSVLMLEQSADPSSPLKRLPFGMRGLTIPTMEAFYRRGLLDDIVKDNPASIKSLGLQPGKQAGHFAGITFSYSDFDSSKWEYRLPNPADTNIAAELERVEKTLAERALAVGVEIRRGVTVSGFSRSDDDMVTVDTIAKSEEEEFRGKWLVGCDGGRSTIRKVGGFEFVGTEPEFTGYSAKVELAADSEPLPPGKNNTSRGMYSLAPSGQLVMADFDGGAHHREEVTLEHLQSVLRRISGINATLATVHVATTWTDRSAQATTYRKGSVFLAGDAAHIHSPLGGQGLNLGIGDAMNLGWKLAATIHGRAPGGLLDTYTTERHPIGQRVLDWSRAQVAVMRPGQASRALEAIFRDIMQTRDGATYFAERVLGVSLRYDLGSGHPLVGRSAPDFELMREGGGMTVGKLLELGMGLLVDFDSRRELQQLFPKRWTNGIEYLAGEPKERLGLSVLLIRPDGIVAWVCEGQLDIDEFLTAARCWFGAENWIVSRQKEA
ncbi:FAD-dependent monooxygenase [Diplogelasinospora grovesii]|uniref:FAD-dependent monooxygenase n=1 Tax=Diplogelasinospora grovesii TaxID=303347 RepID=A0AAN6N5G2_9PEZI|nr:FAD-dependent monooxygenase [Diplogelasinospora grovesii]